MACRQTFGDVMRYVEATGRYTFNDRTQPPDDQTVRVWPGDLLPVDHWAVVMSPDRFVDVDDPSKETHP